MAAKDSVTQLKQSRDFQQFSHAWSAFLTSTNRIYTKLLMGARPNAKSRQWAGNKKQERKNDPLLQYLHQARNSDEHGIAPVAELIPGSFGIGTAPGHGAVVIKSIVMKNGILTVDAHPPEALQLTLTPPQARLARVFDDRNNIWYEPPSQHLGQPVTGTDPVKVAQLALNYFEGLLTEAESLPWLA